MAAPPTMSPIAAMVATEWPPALSRINLPTRMKSSCTADPPPSAPPDTVVAGSAGGQEAPVAKGWRTFLRREFGLARLRGLWDQARREHSTPREVGWSVAVGVFSGCTPLWGLHMWIALGLASVLKLNRLWAFLGSRVSMAPIFVWIVFVEIELAHRVRTGAWAALTPTQALERGRELLGDWALGAPVVGLGLGAVLGLAAYGLALLRPVRDRTPGEPRPPSSGSPP